MSYYGRQKYSSLFQQAFSVSDFLIDSEPNACGCFLRESLSCRKLLYTTDICFLCVVFYLLAPCNRGPVGPQDIKT